MKWFRSSAAVLALLICTAAWGGMVSVYNPQTGKLDYVGAPGVGIAISPTGTITATGQAVIANSIPFSNVSSALRDHYLDKTGTAAAASTSNAYKGNSAPSATEFSYLQGVTSAIQSQLAGKADNSALSLVATTGQYGDLSGKPSIPSALSQMSDDSTHRTVTDTQTAAWDGKQSALGYTAENTANKGTANGYPSLDGTGKIPSAQVPTLNQNTTGTAAGLTAQYIDWSLTSGGASIKNKPNLATVATTGNYSDLNGKPVAYTLPTATTSVLGGVKIDGNSIQIDGAGVIHSTVAAGVSSVNGYTGVIDLQTTDITGFDNYSSSVKARLAGKMDNVNPTYSGTLGTTNADNTHFSWDYNTASCPADAPEGAKCTLPSGIYWFKSGVWTQAGMLPAYTLPPATSTVIGGVKPGTALAVDSNGVLSVMVNSLGPSGLVTAGLAGDQTISSGFAYVATATPWKATFNSFTSTKQTTVYANYSGTVCAASGSKVVWANPVTFANTSSQCAKLRTGTRATVQMQGGRTLATVTQNLQKANVPSASVSPTSLAFGSVGTGSTSTLTATLTNSGLANLVTGSPSITGTDAAKFAIASNGCNAATVIPGATCSEGITFTPGATAGGPYSAQLSIPHNASGAPTVLALTGTGIVTDPYTTYFANSFVCADGSSIVSACTTSNAWTSLTGTQGSISSGRYVIAKSAASTSDYLTTGGLAAHSQVQLKLDVIPTQVTGAGQSVAIAQLIYSGASSFSVKMLQTSGAYNKWEISYKDGAAATQVVDSSAYTFAAGHTYSARFVAKYSTTTSSADGNFTLYISDNGGTESAVLAASGINTYRRNPDSIAVGVIPDGSVTNTWSFDNVALGYM